MFAPLAAASLTALTLSLAVAPLFAQEIGDTMGVYDDWSVHLLQDGGIRVCYAETKLVPSQEAGSGLGDLRFR